MQPQLSPATLEKNHKQQVQRENMAFLGQLTSGIAHEIYNPLNFVKNFSESCLELMNEMNGSSRQEDAVTLANEIKMNLAKVVQYSNRAEAIIKNMMEHSRISKGEKQKTNINELLQQIFRYEYLLKQQKNKDFDVAISFELDNILQDVEINPFEIGKVVSNLLTNSFYAISEKKKMLGNYKPTIVICTKMNGSTFEISIQDNGTGIKENVVDKVFQPFFTTKPSGEGTGLGLSLSYDIVTNGHDGEIKVETAEGEYTEFKITLPVYQ